MDAYLIIGNSRTRKASVVRSLTGCFNRSVRDIQPARGSAPLRLYARVGALQETRVSPADFLNEAAGKRCDGVLFCLWPTAHPLEPAAYPDAQAYIAHLQAAGWHFRSMAVLGQNGGDVRSPGLERFPNAPTLPINVTAHAVRTHFGWR